MNQGSSYTSSATILYTDSDDTARNVSRQQPKRDHWNSDESQPELRESLQIESDDSRVTKLNNGLAHLSVYSSHSNSESERPSSTGSYPLHDFLKR